MLTDCPNFKGSASIGPAQRLVVKCAGTKSGYVDAKDCAEGCPWQRVKPRPAPTPVSASVAAARLATCLSCDQHTATNADDSQVDCKSGCSTCGGAQPALVTLSTGQCQRGKWTA